MSIATTFATFMEFANHPVTKAVFDGVKYTAPKVAKAIQETMDAKKPKEEDVQKAAESFAEPEPEIVQSPAGDDAVPVN